jgi:hypothetical protein
MAEVQAPVSFHALTAGRGHMTAAELQALVLERFDGTDAAYVDQLLAEFGTRGARGAPVVHPAEFEALCGFLGLALAPDLVAAGGAAQWVRVDIRRSV